MNTSTGSKSGSDGDWFHIGLASNKRYMSLYVMATDPSSGGYLAESYKDLFPKADIGRSCCVRFRRPDDVDRHALTQMIYEGEIQPDRRELTEAERRARSTAAAMPPSQIGP